MFRPCLSIAFVLAVALASCGEAEKKKEQDAPARPVAAVAWIDTIPCGPYTIYVMPLAEDAFREVPPSGPDVLAGSDNEPRALAASRRMAVKRKGLQLIFKTGNRNQVSFTDVESGPDGSPEVQQYRYVADMGTMGYWLVRHTMPDFTEWIWVHKKEGALLKTAAYGAISPGGKYYLATVCGGEGNPCNDAELHLYENKPSGMTQVAGVSLMPSRGWMPDDIHWQTDSTAVAAVVLEEDSEGKPIRGKEKIPAYVQLTLRKPVR